MKIQAVAAALMILVSAKGGAGADTCKEITPDVIKKHLAFDDFRVVSKREVNGLCELIIDSDSRLLPFYGNKEFLISGEMFVNGVSLAERKLYDIKRDMLKAAVKDVEACVAFTYTPGEVKTGTQLYMFTDPLCPFCNRAGLEIKELSDRLGFRVKVIFLNVHGEKGRAKCIEAVCRNEADPSFNLEAYNGQEWKKSEPDKRYECKKGAELVDRSEKMSEKLGIDSVPFFFINDGRHVSGAAIDEVELLFNSSK